MAIVVRRATIDDAALISSLNADVQAIHAAELPWRFKAPGPETFPPSSAASLLANPNNLVFVADIDSEPAGYAYAEVIRRGATSFHHAYETIYLHHISVRSERRRCGVGGRLIEAVRAAGHELGISLVTLDVWSFNDEARAFFRRHGFTPYIERLWSR
ncbi:MAG TPA: GNAT family N-acetyltransferase [Xanthobacteraceae bacterium]|nr:GNAT family N-acetyltransferase [Xanthobacteraceae bacterium]